MPKNTQILITVAAIIILIAGGIGLAYYNGQISSLREELSMAVEQKEELRRETTALEEELNDKEAELEETREKLARAEDEHDDLFARLSEKETELDELHSLLNDREDELASVESRLESKANDLDSKAAEINSLQDKIAEQETEINELRSRLDEKAAEIEELLSRNDNGPPPGGAGPTAYLTFDDGPSNNTLAILDILAEENILATFFVIGNNQSDNPDAYRLIVEAGHVLGNHTYSHDYDYIYDSPENFMDDLLKLEEFLYAETGVETNIMRFPGGSSSQMAQDVSGYNIIVEDLIPEVIEQGYDYFDWNVTSGDAVSRTPPAEDIVDNVLSGADSVSGDIVVLMHDSQHKTTTVEALPQIIEGLRQRGYQFEVLSPGAIDVRHR
ncbi:polysaccharide deacetylase family protein [Dethiobacter alkaliphilus]|uniref:Polysaccharide deacetylase n=1 Tax=Dethiobacter alkaliphilus AHT 1 TaxID=555088 RepID=C0GHZ8_DETAL|nr:polysaccharide deacetylase family protein [Dethiobacter alkaliphilus]EEG77072.1 polysaccharide deacetylase [Dethiobacter alkaliphilus AHT 1]